MAILKGDDWVASVSSLGDAPGQLRCQEPLTPASGPVCVTGASGFIALHLVRELLQKGYTVVGTVRSASNQAKLGPLSDLQSKFGAEKLKIVGGVDCTRPETFEHAVAGCVGVFHTASPFTFNAPDPMKDLVMPAVQGTLGCLKACQAVGTVRRVIVTSSFASVFNPGKYPWDYQYTSRDWNTVSCPDQAGKFPEPAAAQGYRYSKALAEKTAWDFAAQADCKFDIVCINPPMVVGCNLNTPSSPDDLNTSSGIVLRMLLGQQAPNPNSIGWVDVADVARAHCFTYEHPEAGGKRFLCAADQVPLWTEVAQILKELYPGAPVITDPPSGGPGLRMGLDTSGLKSLGFDFTPLRDTLKAQCESFKQMGFARL